MNHHDALDRELKSLLKSKAEDVAIPDPVQNAVENVLSSLPKQKRKKRFPSNRWRWLAAAVVFFVLLSAISVSTVPIFSEMLRSLFAKDNPDIGLLRAQELGLVHNPHIKVKDKGYTLVINEAVADPTRVTIALQLFDPKGKHNRDKLVIGNENQITIKDREGNKVDTMYDMGYTNDFYYLVAFFREPLQTDRITIEGNVQKLGQRNETPIEGDWNFSFDMDMKEANSKTTIEELSGSYTTPHGMTVTLKRLTRMVQGVRLELETELSDEAMARSPGDLWENQMLSFHFETMDKEEIHAVNPRKQGFMDSLMTSDHMVIGNGKMHWSYTFKYLPEEEPYRFVLDAYSVAELDGSQIAFKPAELVDPKGYQVLNDHFELNGTVLEKSDIEQDTNEMVISFYAELENEFDNNVWKAVDVLGNEYEVDRRGVSFLVNTLPDNWREGLISMGDRGMKQPYHFEIKGLSHIPEQLTLIREVVDKRYQDPNWSVLLNP
ncbi:DUF4179 domain-containing protein [Paenibacillus tundrae]|uniref:DUF4179 domain-containing protein n=1 Tax=Paenibacillus tundrae TaxID=528187 RepID=A0ABT9WE14_9BACL|nr:DUF4179 domain-containing protein [Paenibacillus tundrae]MDQ0171506.1 hypothetical protein [Paenibacillus tundrae]